MLQKTIILSFLFCSLLTYSQDNKIKSELVHADKLIEKKQYAQALEHVEAALAIDDLYLGALEKKMNIKLITDDSKGALKEIEGLIEVNPQQAEYFYLRAIVYLYKQKPKQALEDLKTAEMYGIPEEYQDRLYLNKGVANYQLGYLDMAEVNYQEALEINPKYATIYHSWGMVDYERGMYEEAIDKFSQAVHFGDDRAILYYNLGMSYLKLDDKKNACYHFKKACNQGYKNGCKQYLFECSE